MIIYKSAKNSTLIPVFIGFLLLLTAVPSLNTKIAEKFSNTDTFSAAAPNSPTPVKSLENRHAIELENLEETSVASSYLAPLSASAATVSACPTPVDAALSDFISLCGRVIPLSENTINPAGVSPPAGVAYKYRYNSFIYGHNSADVFGDLYGLLAPGDKILVSLGGVKTEYTVTGSYYNQSPLVVDDNFIFLNGSDNLAIMTCAPGVVDGATDFRRVVFVATK